MSKTSSKFEVDEFEEEAQDKDLKSKFDSSSSESDDEEIVTAKGKLSFLRRNTTTFKKDEDLDEKRSKMTRRNTESTMKKTEGKAFAYDIPDKVKRNTEGYYDKKGWILKKATSTYMGMTNWQRRYLVLKDDKLYFYDGDSDKDLDKFKKCIEMKNTKCVCYHYD